MSDINITIEGGKSKRLLTAGKLCKDNIVVEALGGGAAVPILQEKTITQNGDYTPETGYDGFSKVSVEVPIPAGYVKPDGTTNISKNGLHNVGGFLYAQVDVPAIDPVLQEKAVTITENGTVEITQDSGYDGLSKAVVTVNVLNVIPDGYIKPSGTKSITANGTHDVTAYASVSVNVPTGGTGGTCSGTHIIEVDELPTENIDESAMYSVVKVEFTDAVFHNGSGANFLSKLGLQKAHFHTIPTKTTDGILASDINNDIYHFYYIEDEADVFIYDGSQWVVCSAMLEVPFGGIIFDVSEATEAGYYVFMSRTCSYHSYTGKRLVEIYVNFYGEIVPYSIFVPALNPAMSVYYHYVDTTPADEDILQCSDTVFHLYYVADLQNIYIKSEDGEWEPNWTGDIQIVSSEAEITSYPAAIIDTNEWASYVVPTGSLEITKTGTYDVTDKSQVMVSVPATPDAAVCGIWELNQSSFTSLGSWKSVELQVNFTTVIGGETKNCTKIVASSSDGIDYSIDYYLEDGSRVSAASGTYYEPGWVEDTMRTVDFGAEPQLVFSEGKNWLTSNATPIYQIVRTDA